MQHHFTTKTKTPLDKMCYSNFELLMKLFRSKAGFTLVEIMIVVAILGILLIIVTPGFLKARRQSRDKMCQNNLRLISHALKQYKIDENLADTTDATAVYNGLIVNSPNAYIEKEPLCPIGLKRYNVTTVDADPTCPNRDSNPTDIDYQNHVLK